VSMGLARTLGGGIIHEQLASENSGWPPAVIECSVSYWLEKF
jgi:hypothetical protein